MNPQPPTPPARTVRPRPLPKPTITRIDFFRFNESFFTGRDRTVWRVLKFAEGWTATTPPVEAEIEPAIRTAEGEQPFDIELALTLLEQGGWRIRRWPNGARAWKGEILPVRGRGAILRMRERANQALLNGDGDGLPWRADFALDY